jgi:uncharacterized coiled-coil protein SlyX
MSEDFSRSKPEYPEDHPHSEYVAASSAPAAPARGSWLGVVLILFVVALLAYGFHERRIAGQLAAQNGEMRASLNATRSQIDAMTAKLNELTAAQSERPAAVPATVHHASAKHATARHRRADDPRWKQLQSQISEQGKQIDATRQDLSNTRTELQGSIARTHDELVLLEKKGERSYFEFDIDKNGQFQHDGPVGIRLKKANTKHDYADLELMVDDYKLSKKHVNIYEPVVFYAAENGQPVELVINSISKNHIHGYVSQPKYRVSELQAMAGSSSAGNATTSTAPTPPQRQKLEPPQ